MRVVVGVVAFVLLLAAQASAGDEDPVVRITVAEPGEHVVVAVANPRTNGYEAPLTSVEPMIPDPLPTSPGVSSCPAGQSPSELTLTFASGSSVRYTGCALLDEIRRLGGAVRAEAAQWWTPAVTRTVITGATRAEERELRRLRRDLPLTTISQITFGPQAARLKGIADAPVAMTVNNGPLRVKWEAGLLAGLYNQVAARLDLRPVATVDVKGGGSPLRPGIASRTSIDLGPVRRFVAGTDAEIVELRALTGAVAITLQAPSPAAFLAHDGRGFMSALLGNQRQASVYYAVQDAYGSIVYGGGWLPGHGMFFTRPDLDACGPVTHGQLAIGADPPCPV